MIPYEREAKFFVTKNHSYVPRKCIFFSFNFSSLSLSLSLCSSSFCSSFFQRSANADALHERATPLAISTSIIKRTTNSFGSYTRVWTRTRARAFTQRTSGETLFNGGINRLICPSLCPRGEHPAVVPSATRNVPSLLKLTTKKLAGISV